MGAVGPEADLKCPGVIALYVVEVICQQFGRPDGVAVDAVLFAEALAEFLSPFVVHDVDVVVYGVVVDVFELLLCKASGDQFGHVEAFVDVRDEVRDFFGEE